MRTAPYDESVERDSEVEPASGSRPGDHIGPDGARHPAGEGEPETGSVLARRVPGLEDLLELVVRHARPVVHDGDDDVTRFAGHLEAHFARPVALRVLH